MLPLGYLEGGPMTLPRAGGWMLVVMGIVALCLLPIFPFILRHRRRRAQRELHERIEHARAEILADGKVEGPPGPYVQHEPWNAGTDASTPRDGPPRPKAYHGTEWQ